VLYNTNLPNTPISDLEISPAAPGLLRAATYGRGVYEVGVVPPPLAAPVSNFNVTGQICVNKVKTFNDASSNSPTTWSWSVTPSAGVSIVSSNSQNPNITFPNAGIYTVSMVATNTIGAGGIITQTVSVTANPTVNLASSFSVCSGNTATITASGASTYSWNTGSVSSIIYVSPASNTNYTVTGTLAGCSDTKTTALTLLPLPSVSAGPNNQQVCEGTLITYTANGAATYTWLPNNTTGSTFTDTPMTSQTYTCIGTGLNGCSVEQPLSVIVIVCTQLGENSKVSFALYPNPAKDVLFLQLSANVLSKIQVSVVDVSGKIILSKSLEKAQKDEAIAIDVKGLSAGTYFAQLKTGNQVQKVKFIKD
jgi:PKD repeat protein